MDVQLSAAASRRPEILYKYLPAPGATEFAEENLNNLLGEGRIRLTCAREVNDVFEYYPHIDDDLTEDTVCSVVERLWDDGPSGAQDTTRRDELRRRFPDRLNIRREGGELLRNTRHEIISGEKWLEWFQRTGFYCLAEDPLSPVMWAHYGSQHSGVCVGFRREGLLFPASAMPMNYFEARPSVKASALFNASQGAFSHGDLKTILLGKGNHWSYEREWRFLGIHPYKEYTAGGGEFVDFDRTATSSILFGIRSKDSTKQFVQNLVSDLVPQPGLFDLRRSPANYQLVVGDSNMVTA